MSELTEDQRNMLRHLSLLASTPEPTRFQLIEAWQIAQALHGACWPRDQERLDAIRRQIIQQYLCPESGPAHGSHKSDNLRKHIVIPKAKPMRSWLEIELSPELTWSSSITWKQVPSALVKRLRLELTRQKLNLKSLERRSI